jgi:hypothetical protein
MAVEHDEEFGSDGSFACENATGGQVELCGEA